MCYFDQHVYGFGDWKWGNFQQHCGKEYRIGETCGMKMCYQTVSLPGKCGSCEKIESKLRRMQKGRQDLARWSQPDSQHKYRASIDKANEDIESLQLEIHQLNEEKRGRYRVDGSSNRRMQAVEQGSSELTNSSQHISNKEGYAQRLGASLAHIVSVGDVLVNDIGKQWLIVEPDSNPKSVSFAIELAITISERLDAEHDLLSINGAFGSAANADALRSILKTFSILLGQVAYEESDLYAVRLIQEREDDICNELMTQLHMNHTASNGRMQDNDRSDTAMRTDQAARLSKWIADESHKKATMSHKAPRPNTCASEEQDDTQMTDVDSTSLDSHDIEQSRQFILKSKAFVWLLAQIRQLMCLEKTAPAYVVQSHISTLISQNRHARTINMSLSYVGRELLDESQQTPKLGDMIVYSGHAERCYATTVDEYVQRYWPSLGKQVVDAVETTSLIGSALILIAGGHFSGELHNGQLTVSLYGDAPTMLEMAEILVWLSMACRESPEPSQPMLCSPQFVLERDLVVKPVFNAIPQASMTDGMCWLRMVRNPVIVEGYMIPARTESQKGLEVSFAVLVAMSQATFAATFKSFFILKGIISALVPVLVDNSSIVWHFYLNNYYRLSYKQACVDAPHVDLETSDIDHMTTRRHFVGL